MRFRTRAVHVGQEKDASTGATIPPIHVTTTFTQDGVGKHKGFEYSRTGNPTRASLEELIASLEGASYGVAFASGMAATHAVISLLPSGSHLILSSDVYGGTYRLVDKVLSSRGLDYSLADTTDLDEIRSHVRSETAMLFVETPTNPLLRITDIAALKETVGPDVLLVVDNTFATPYFQRPMELGADIVVHSSTKYLGGHSDVVGGLAVTNDSDRHESLKFLQNSVGAVPSPFDCYLTIRGIKTLPLRMEAHQRNALAIAQLLEKHPRAGDVFYPGLAAHNGHALAASQMSGFSGIVSFRVAGGPQAAHRFLESLQVFALAESLGGIESLACLPARMTHAALGEALREKLGVTDDLVRLSVGIEDSGDLMDDISRALERSQA